MVIITFIQINYKIFFCILQKKYTFALKEKIWTTNWT